ncbi:MAG TPA: hypothetical protein VFU01_19985 [Gemmatimonadaceae bacterium]|nr:hypothetical protein [Gemmatimonadaceae bacterium]
MPCFAFGVAGMGLAAVAFGNLTRTEWTLWLVPLTIAVDGSLLFRAPIDENGRVLWPSRVCIFTDPEIPSYLLSSLLAAGLAAWGAYVGHRAAIIVGAAFAVLVSALERNEEPRFDRTMTRHARRHEPVFGDFGGTWHSAPHFCRTRAIATIVYRIRVAQNIAAVAKQELPVEWEAPHNWTRRRAL